MAILHDLPLVSTVAVGLSAAFVLGLAASKLRIPPIVGYLLAGILIGPYTPGFVADIKLAEQLSEIGIVLLMFGVGLHFSLKDLMEVKRIAIPGAVAQIATATAMGAGLSHFWGWPLESGLMFGLALSVASTVVLLRTLETHGLVQTTNGRIAIGWLIVEDLVMVLALVMIPVLATQDENATTAELLQHLGIALLKICAFIAFMFIIGRRALPRLLTIVAATRSRELFTLAVFAVAVGLAYGAGEVFGVTLSLGAFFAGMMIRESDLNHEVADRALPFQDAFAVLFFVAVGMLFNPAILIEQPLNVMAVTAIIMIGKSIAALLLILLLRYPLKTGFLVSAGLAQIGEFSFILVTLGLTYGLLPDEGQNLILAGAMISIALNPLTFILSKALYEWAGRNPRLSNVLNLEDDSLAHLSAEEQRGLKNLVILVGWGFVGQHVSDNLRQAHIDLVVIDENRERIEELRNRGLHAIAGDATRGDTLNEAAIGRARAVIVAIPDPFTARHVVDTARQLKPGIKIIVRADNEEEYDYFVSQNVDKAITGRREIGNAIISYLQDQKLAP